MTATVRVYVYTSDPLLTFVRRAGDHDDYYEVPPRLLYAVEAAERARDAAVDAVEAYIRDNNVPKVDPMEAL